MSLKERFTRIPFFWKMFLFVSALLVFVVSLVEAFLEPLVEEVLLLGRTELPPWHEAALWAVSIFIPALASGYILSKMLDARLAGMARISKSLAKGNFAARLHVTNNDNDSFDILARNLNEMAEAIQNQIYNERRLLADISHELRSPLTRMTITTELLAKRENEEARHELVLRLQNEVGKMGDLVSLLLAQARDRIATKGREELLDFSELLNDLADDYDFQGTSQGKTVKAGIENGMTIHGNAIQLRGMVGNILSNALFYSPENGEVLFDAAHDGNSIVVTIRDFGPGVPPEHLKSIFHVFSRVDSSRTRSSGGVGLGLALAREAAERHGGGIDARNASPGLLITIRLPLTKEEAGHPTL